MKTRIELLYSYNNIDHALIHNGFSKSLQNARLYVKDCELYKIAWVHRNDFGQITYIDLLPV